MRAAQSSIFALCLSAVGLSVPASFAETPAEHPLHWFEGCSEVGNAYREVWRGEAGLLFGFAVQLDETGTASFFEQTRIEPNAEGGYTFAAYPAGKGPTFFKSTYADESEVEFVNPDNDYPQKIKYYIVDGQFSAEISSLDGSGATGWNFTPCAAD